MNAGAQIIIYPVTDLAKAKAQFRTLLCVEPYADQPYYVGFRLGEQEIGLDPSGHKNGMTMPVGYYRVDNIQQSLQDLVTAGAQVHQEVRNVGGGRLIAIAKDADGNLVGLVQDQK